MKGFYIITRESQVQVTKELVKALPIHQRHELAITGKDLLAILEETPGKWLGELIAEIEQHVVEGSLENKQEVLLSFAKNNVQKERKHNANRNVYKRILGERITNG